MKPQEFWNSTYREVSLYCQMNILRTTDDFKTQIDLYDVATHKMLEANPLLNKNPKIKLIRESYKKLFKEKEEEQSIEEQIAILRSMKKMSKNVVKK